MINFAENDYTMKKILLFVLALLMLAPFAKAQTGGDDPVVIIVTGSEGSNGDDPDHRSPNVAPFEVSYYASLSSLLLSFPCDMGYITVTVENLTTGATTQDVINALTGDQFFPISSVPGDYEITFLLPDGHVYIGLLEIE